MTEIIDCERLGCRYYDNCPHQYNVDIWKEPELCGFEAKEEDIFEPDWDE